MATPDEAAPRRRRFPAKGTRSRRWQYIFGSLILAGAAIAAGISLYGSTQTVSGDGTPDVAALNAEASTAVPYASGKAFVRAIDGALVASCTSPQSVGSGLPIDTVGCTVGSGDSAADVVAYVGKPGELPGFAYSTYLATARKTLAETQPVGETVLLLIGKRWFVNGGEETLIDVQDALGGRLVVVGG